MRAGDCKHFTGIQHAACEAGVRYETVRDSTAGPYRWPCLPNNGRPCATACASFQAMTTEEEAAEDAIFDAAWVAVTEGRCPQCGAVLDKREGGGATTMACATHGLIARQCDRAGGL